VCHARAEISALPRFSEGERIMRQTLLASATMLALACSLPAMAQSYGAGGETWAHQPGTGMSGPASNQASNIGSHDSRSPIAPHLPQPEQGENGTPEAYLRDAERALVQHKTGLAQQALEMAETRLLDRSTAPEAASMPDQRPEIAQVSYARQALGTGNVRAASAAIQMALSSARPMPR
jgi:hypothetical protein